MPASDHPADTPALAERRRIAERVRAACLEAARQGYAQAAVAGLCHEGAMEAALGAIEMLDLNALLEEALE
jgi:hypothetical protein